MAVDAAWVWLCNEIETALHAFTFNLEGLDGGAKVPNLEWTVAELTAHLASMPRLYRHQNKLGSDFAPPDDWAAFSIEQRSHIDTTDLAHVVAHLESEVDGFLDELDRIDDLDGHRWLYGQSTTHRNVAAAILLELVIHGEDLARLGGVAPVLTREQANAGLPGMMALLPAFVDAERAAKAAGVYHLRFRGGDDWTYRIGDDGVVEVERGRPERCDAHLSADPAAFVLVGLGRRNPVLAALRGRMIVWGRRPWKFAATADMSVEGV